MKQAASPIPSPFNLASISNLVPIFHIPTTANLLDEHISMVVISHIIKLCLLVHTQDTLSKVLIIGDLVYVTLPHGSSRTPQGLLRLLRTP